MKQYLMMCDDRIIDAFKLIFRPEALQLLEVQGVGMGQGNAYNLLATPVNPPVTPAVISTPPTTEQPESAEIQSTEG